MLKGMLDYIRSDTTDAKRSVSGSSQLYIIASTSANQSVRGSHNMDESSSTSGSYSSVEGPSPHPVQLLAPPFPVNAPAGLCGPVLVGASSYGQVKPLLPCCQNVTLTLWLALGNHIHFAAGGAGFDGR